MQAHFSALQPTSVRLLTEKTNPARSRGIAFVEFADFARMKTCLAKFHHTEFPDPAAGADATRRINVELTAGGGGNKSEGRQEKIRAKNAKLNEERARRMAAEEEAKRAKKDGGAAAGEKKEEGSGEGEEAREELEEGWIHPSRRAHVPGRENDYQSQEVPETSTGGGGGGGGGGFAGGRFRGGGGRGGGGRGGRGGRGGGKRGAPRGRRS